VHILLATDAAGEGINLQRAHLMVNYDLPWNPNRLEQRFGRIHRIGQTEVCYLWNLVAEETREGEVYRKLLEKLELARQALGGQVFDVLGKLQFENNKSLRDLLLEAIRYGEQPEVQSYLTTVLDKALDRGHLQSLLDEGALANDVMDATKIQSIREEMERADAKRLQPHFIESFFLEAFKQLGGSLKQKETRRFEVTNVPSPIRTRDRMIGIREPVLQKYERIVFDKPLISPAGQIPAAFVCPGHPLLDAVTDLTIERHRNLLKRGAILVDERDNSQNPRVLFFLEHGLQDAGLAKNGERRVISKRMLFVEIDSEENERYLHYAPYLDYRPLLKDEINIDQILNLPECSWITKDLESKALSHAINNLVPEHLKEVKDAKLKLLDKTKAAVKDRLTKEIIYWDHRAEELKLQESAGKINAKLNSSEARKRADALQARLEKRFKEIDLESQISPLPPIVIGGALIIPIGLLNKTIGTASDADKTNPKDTLISAARAREVIMKTEKDLGFIPIDRELEKLGYDIESKDPKTGKLRFIEVKGRIQGAATITVTRNEILYSLNKPEDFILAIVEFTSDIEQNIHYVREPFKREPDFGVTSVNYDFSELLLKSKKPS
jgi:hypothetical protein